MTVFAQDPAPLSGLRWGSSYALSGDASTILVGAAGRVLPAALYGGQQDRAINGQVILTSRCLLRCSSYFTSDCCPSHSYDPHGAF